MSRENPVRPYSDRNQGRKPLPEAERTKKRGFRLTDEQFAQVQALGGADWLRGAIERAFKRLKKGNEDGDQG